MLIIRKLGLVLDPSSAKITSVQKVGKSYEFTIGDVNQSAIQCGTKEELMDQWAKYSQLIYPEPKTPKRTLIVDMVSGILDPVKNDIENGRMSTSAIAEKYNLSFYHVARWAKLNNIVLPPKSNLSTKLIDLLNQNKDKVSKMLNARCSTKSMAMVLGYTNQVNQNVFSQFKRDNNVVVNKASRESTIRFEGCSKRELVIINRFKINNRIEKGYTRKKLCEWLDISESSFCETIKDKSIGIMNIPRPKSMQQIKSEEISSRLNHSSSVIRNLLNQGVSQRTIAKSYEISQAVLSKWVNNN